MTGLIRRLTRTITVAAILAVSMILPGSAFATSSPITWKASDITEEKATLNAVVFPEGLETTYHFEYSYGETEPVSAGSDSTAVQVSAEVEGPFEQEVEYSFRVVQENALGTSYGEYVSFFVPGFATESYPANLSGAAASTHSLLTPGGYINCTNSTLTGSELTEASGSLTFTPTLSGCNAGSFFGMNGCEFKFNATSGSGFFGKPKGTMDIVGCDPGKEIFLNVLGYCSPGGGIRIAEQTGIGPVAFETVGFGSSRELKVTVGSENLKYTCAGVKKTNGIYTGSWLVKAVDLESNPMGLWVQ